MREGLERVREDASSSFTTTSVLIRAVEHGQPAHRHVRNFTHLRGKKPRDKLFMGTPKKNYNFFLILRTKVPYIVGTRKLRVLISSKMWEILYLFRMFLRSILEPGFTPPALRA